jgi:hypothetical protein
MKSMAVEQRNLRRRCDEVALEAALGWQPVSTFVEPEAESGPTDAELREQAKALGLPVPPPREGTAARFRSGLDPTGEQLVKDLNAVRQGRGDTPQGKFGRDQDRELRGLSDPWPTPAAWRLRGLRPPFGS